MANIRNSNTAYVDSGSSLIVPDANVKLAYVIFTSSSAGDSIVLRDGGSSGALKLKIKNGVATDSRTHRFDAVPMVFPNGIYVDTISSGATATLITTSKVS